MAPDDEAKLDPYEGIYATELDGLDGDAHEAHRQADRILYEAHTRLGSALVAEAYRRCRERFGW